MEDQAKISITKEQLLSGIKGFLDKDFYIDVEISTGKIARFKIKPAGLEDHMHAQSISQENLRKLGLHPKTYFEISIFHNCVLYPEVSLQDVISLSKAHPEIINEVVSKILKLKPSY